MENSLNDFARRIKRHGIRIEANANKEVIQLGGLVSQTVITATPVDEGTARGNWFATVSAPRRSADEKVKDPSGSNRITQNAAAMSARLSGQAIYITNNLPYIKRLNEGWSAQAPAGYVEAAVRTARAAIKRIRLLKT